MPDDIGRRERWINWRNESFLYGSLIIGITIVGVAWAIAWGVVNTPPDDWRVVCARNSIWLNTAFCKDLVQQEKKQ